MGWLFLDAIFEVLKNIQHFDNIYSQHTYKKVNPWIILRLSLDSPQILPGFSMDYPWILPGLLLDNPLIIPRIYLGYP